MSTVVTDADTLYSSYRERLIEHLFVGEVLRELWLSGVSQVEVLRAEVDGAARGSSSGSGHGREPPATRFSESGG